MKPMITLSQDYFLNNKLCDSLPWGTQIGTEGTQSPNGEQAPTSTSGKWSLNRVNPGLHPKRRRVPSEQSPSDGGVSYCRTVMYPLVGVGSEQRTVRNITK